MLENNFLGLFVLSAGLTDPQLTVQSLVQLTLRQSCGCVRLQLLIPKAFLPQPLPSVTYAPALHTTGM